MSFILYITSWRLASVMFVPSCRVSCSCISSILLRFVFTSVRDEGARSLANSFVKCSDFGYSYLFVSPTICGCGFFINM